MPDLTTESVVADYLRYKVTSEGLKYPSLAEVLGGSAGDNRSGTPTPFQSAVRQVTRLIEERYRRDVNGEAITDSLHLTPSNASSTFHRIVHVLFRSDGTSPGTGAGAPRPSVGRICALLALSGEFVVRCVRSEMPQLVGDVARWTVDYIDTNLLTWINQHGGWTGLFQPPPVPRDPWMPYRGIMLGVAALGTVTALAMARLKGLF